MPVSKKPRKKAPSKKKTAEDNIIEFAPDPRGMEGDMANIFGSRTKDPLDQAQELM